MLEEKTVPRAGRRLVAEHPGLVLAGAFLAIDVVCLYWVWARLPNWGIWDWDFYQCLFEAARISIVEHHQLPLWNPYLNGGFTLVGHPQVRAFNPSFGLVLAFGTVYGIKVSVLIYLLIAQWGAYLFARAEQLSRPAAFVAALVFSLSGWYSQHIAHGHAPWLGFAWTPFVAAALARSESEIRLRTLALGGVAYGFTLLDGGPYAVGFPPLFLGFYGAMLAIRSRTLRPIVAGVAMGLLGAAIAGIQLAPILETFLAYPRETGAVNPFYYTESPDPSWTWMLLQGLLSPEQGHDMQRWMPYVINIGSYVGWIPLMLAAAAPALVWRRAWPIALTAFVSVWIFLGPAAQINLWSILHQLPILGSLQAPTRFNVFMLLAIGILAGHRLDALLRLVARDDMRWAVAALIISVVVVDMTAVNQKVFKVAFAIPPVEVEEKGEFHHELNSSYLEDWPARSLQGVWDNWPNVAFASLLENKGVILAWNNLGYPRSVIPREHADYPGAEVWVEKGGGDLRIEELRLTPNVVTVDLAGGAGRVILNQNYHAGWTLVEGDGRLENVNGRVGVTIEDGDQRLRIAFRPASFFIGAGASSLGLAVVLWLLWRDTTLAALREESTTSPRNAIRDCQ
jgi:hypothetical protein